METLLKMIVRKTKEKPHPGLKGSEDARAENITTA
jgi:hypothetical protein